MHVCLIESVSSPYIYLICIAGAMSAGGGAQVYIDSGKNIRTEQVRRVLKDCLYERLSSLLKPRERVEEAPSDVLMPHPQLSLPIIHDAQATTYQQTHLPDQVNFYYSSILYLLYLF